MPHVAKSLQLLNSSPGTHRAKTPLNAKITANSSILAIVPIKLDIILLNAIKASH